MKICPKCAMTYGDTATLCRRCKLELQQAPEAYTADDDPKKRRKDWLWILIGMPLFILFIKLIYDILISSK